MTRQLTYKDAVNEAIRLEMRNDPSVILIGEDVAGGAGNENHLIKGLQLNGVSAVATANLFNFIGDGLPKARKKIISEGFNLASWE